MTVTIGSATFSNLVAQPFGYEQTNTQAGLTARAWTLTGLLTPAEWLGLIGEYDEWRDARIQDEDSSVSGVIGTVIAFSGTGAGGEEWSGINCWFLSAPEAEQSGGFLQASIRIVDAEQALEVILRQAELEAEQEDLPDLGTITIGAATLTLLAPPDSFGFTPELSLTAGGVHFIAGPLVAYETQDIQGSTDAAGWAAVREWYAEQVISRPATGDWYPISAPTASAQVKVINGVKTTEYIVSISLGKVI